jgi:hypothetical protein
LTALSTSAEFFTCRRQQRARLEEKPAPGWVGTAGRGDAVQPAAQDVGVADPLAGLVAGLRARPASAMMAWAASKSPAETSGSWARVSDRTHCRVSFQRIRVS